MAIKKEKEKKIRRKKNNVGKMEGGQYTVMTCKDSVYN